MFRSRGSPRPPSLAASNAASKAAKKEPEFFRYDADHAFMNEQRMAAQDRHAAEGRLGPGAAFLHKHLG